MFVGVLTTEILIPGSASLKDKRVVLNRIRDRVRKKYNVSVAEIDYNDKWQRSLIAFAIVSSDKSFTDQMMQKIFRDLDNEMEFEIIKYQFDYR
ncbi:MAG: DUF503 domain-containing protein [Calditrichaceae bacterium]